MDRIINFTLKNKFAVWLLTIIVTVAGLYSGLNMKLEMIPDINTPVISVTTVYPGATPEEVADKVSEPIEKAVQNLNGVNVVSSTSFQNASAVQIEYDYGKDMDEAKVELEDALSSIQFPDGVNKPKISKVSINAFPILSLSISNEKESLAKLTKTVEKDIVPALKGIDGVSSVQISGQQTDEVQVVFNDKKLAQYGLSEETVKNFIKGEDITYPLGLYTFKDKEQSVVVDGNLKTIEQLKALEIPVIPSTGSQNNPQTANQGNPARGPQGGFGASPQSGSPAAGLEGGSGMAPQGNAAGARGGISQGSIQGQPQQSAGLPTVKLGDIADIKLVSKAESISRTNGKESIGLQIVKAADANTVKVANDVKKELKKFENKIDGLEAVTTFDQAKPIEDSVNTMLSKALFGAVFAVVIILLFLRNIKTTLIAVISIPMSLLIAILVLNQMDITLNMMTLGAMTVAIGRVIDDSIVVIENIYRRMSLKGEKLKGMNLIREATKEMFIPIMSSTIVTIAVFLPLALVKGMVGELFLPFALTIVFSLLASLLVAITIVPMMAHSLFKKGLKEGVHHDGEKPGRLARAYKKVLNWSLNHKIITSLLALFLFAGSLFLVPVIGVSFLPSDQEKMMVATYKPAPGETLDQVKKYASDAEKYFLKRDNVETVQLSLGSENPMNPGDTNSAILFIKYDKDTPNFEKEKEKVIKDLQRKTAEGEWASQNYSSSAGSNEIVYYVYGEKREDIEPVVKEIQAIMKKDKSFTKIDSSISETYDEFTLVPNQKKLSRLGLTAAQIGMELSQTRERPVLTTIEKDGEELNVYLQDKQESYESVKDMTKKTIQSPLGIKVPVSELVKIKKGKTSDTVTRRDGRIYAEVSAELTTKDVSKASAKLQKEVDKIHLPSNVEISTGGVTKDIQQTFTQLGLAMLAAIAIVYFILVVTFGGALAPFTILFSLPFTIIGALVALLISGETISVSAMIGALMLIGIVVTNAIVLIDRVIRKENEGLSTREALLEAGSTRLRPILMTAIATVGALLPLAFGMEGSGLISKALGVTVIGGLTSSTLLTLLIVPIVYESISKLRRKKNRQIEE